MNLEVFALLLLIVQLTTATSLNSCTYHEFCIDLKECPAFRQYANQSFQTWPENVRSMAREKHCNTEHIGNLTVLSVCCPSVMNNRTCGVLGEDRISKGDVAKPFEYRWMAMLMDKKVGRFVCGGSLISSRYVLTAAHCVKQGDIISVRLGENDLDQIEDCITLDDETICADPPQDIAVEEIIAHPEHSNRMKTSDIALLRLKRPATLSHSVGTVCLPDGTPEQQQLKPWTYFVAGWGRTENASSSNVLRYVKLPAVPLETCSNRLRRTIHSTLKLDERHICAGGVDLKDNCYGDSGGPLHYVSNVTSKYVQQGVVAFGIKTCGKTSEVGVYTNVGKFLSWLVQHVDE